MKTGQTTRNVSYTPVIWHSCPLPPLEELLAPYRIFTAVISSFSTASAFFIPIADRRIERKGELSKSEIEGGICGKAISHMRRQEYYWIFCPPSLCP